MRLADFILRDTHLIIGEWEAFAATQTPAAEAMTRLALRDHVDQILKAIAKDLSKPQSQAQQVAKSHGDAPAPQGDETAAQTHGQLRARSGFNINQMASEYRALRSSVLRLWFAACGSSTPHLDDIIRFNEAIDQALAESVAFYSERVEQARHLFLGTLGHDMRTPLQAIQMTAAYLGRLNAGSTVSEAATRLSKSCKRMQSLLDDLVDFNRVHLGLGITVDRRPGDLGQLLADGMPLLRAAHPGRRIELAVNGSTAGSWDDPSLQRMLDNLVGNALKYGAQDTPVRVVVTGQADEVVVEVHNEGPQIAPLTLETMFDPLQRGVHEDNPGSGHGSLGLGLYISREVARAHGGDLQAQSNPHETVFIARLARQA
jgi:signal transduction histidine kinase